MRLILLPCLFRRFTPSLKGLALFSDFVLTPAKFAVAFLFASVQVFLRLAGQGSKSFLLGLRPRPRWFDGRLFSRVDLLRLNITGSLLRRVGIGLFGQWGFFRGRLGGALGGRLWLSASLGK